MNESRRVRIAGTVGLLIGVLFLRLVGVGSSLTSRADGETTVTPNPASTSTATVVVKYTPPGPPVEDFRYPTATSGATVTTNPTLEFKTPPPGPTP
jgi:hypothetical protein